MTQPLITQLARLTLISAGLAASMPALAAGPTSAVPTRSAAAQPAVVAPGNYLITFDDLAAGATLGNQYAAWGVSFSPNAYTGSVSPNNGWATNTNMSIVEIGGGDTGGLGGPALVSGNLLHSLSGWESENGDASFLLSFDSAITSISIDFAGVAQPSSTGIDIFSTTGAFIASVAATTTGQMTLSYTGSNIGFVGVTPGDFNDWVGVDNVRYTVAAVVPEPETWGLLALGLAGLGVAVRRRRV